MIYLDNAATSFPKPSGMVEAMNLCIRNYCGNPGRSGHFMSVKTGEEIYRARKTLADLLGIDHPERIIFFQNTTQALNQAIKGVLLDGDSVVTTPMEHNSVLRPLEILKYQGVTTYIAKVDLGKQGQSVAEAILSEIRDDTHLVVCAHASNTTGELLPIEEISNGIVKINNQRQKRNRLNPLGRKLRPVLFLVDGAQSVGSVPLNLSKIHVDMLAAPGHKGLLGPQGTGFLYVAPGVEIAPLFEGGTGTLSKLLEIPPEFPEAFECGTLNAPGIVGLVYSADFVGKIGIEAIHSYEKELILPLEEALRNMKNVEVYGRSYSQDIDKTPVVLFNIKGKSCEEVTDILNSSYNIAVRGGFHCAPLAHKMLGTYDTGAVRISAGPFNTKAQINYAIDAVNSIAKLDFKPF